MKKAGFFCWKYTVLVLGFSYNLFAQTGPGGIGEKNSDGKLRMWYDFSNCASTTYPGGQMSMGDITNLVNSGEVITDNQTSAGSYDIGYGFELVGGIDLIEEYKPGGARIHRGNSIPKSIFPYGEYIVAFEENGGFIPVYGVSETVSIENQPDKYTYRGLGFHRTNNQLSLKYYTQEDFLPVTESAAFYEASPKNIASFYGIDQYNTGMGRVRVRLASATPASNLAEFDFPYFMPYWGLHSPPGSSYSVGGKIHEIIAFHQELSEVERHIVFTYLAGKYGLTYNSLVSESPDAPDFELNHEIAGIGYKQSAGSITSATSGEINMSFTTPGSGISYAFLGHDFIGTDNTSHPIYYSGSCVDVFVPAYTAYTDGGHPGYPNLEKYNRTWQYKETSGSNGKDPGFITFSIKESMVPAGYFPAILLNSDPTFPTSGDNITDVVFLQYDPDNHIYFTTRNIEHNTYIGLARRTSPGSLCPSIYVNLSKKVFCENDGAKTGTWTTSHPGVFSGTGFTLQQDNKYSFDPKGLMGDVPVTFTLNSAPEGCNRTRVTPFTVQPRNQILGLPPIICYEGRTQINLNLSPGGGTLSSPTGGVSGASYNPASAGVGSKSITYGSSSSNSCPAVTVETYIYGAPDYLDNILSASAATFSDNWPLDHEHSASTQLHLISTRNFFAGAHKGIWRNEESYTYVTTRKQTLDPDNKNVLLTSKASLVGEEGVKKATSGTFDQMPMFEWNNADMGGCFPNWRRMETVEKYNSFGYETVSRDVINRHAAALYGFNGKLVTAQASNAMQNEIAFEPFEDYTVDQEIKASSDLKGGNLTFYNEMPATANNQYREFQILSAFGNKATLQTPFDPSIAGKEIKVFGANLSQVYGSEEKNSFNDKNVYGIFKIASIEPDPEQVSTRSVIKLEAINYPIPAGPWRGKLSFYESNVNAEFSVPSEKVAISGDKAHTGKQSLKLTGNVAWEQENLVLQRGSNKKYVISAWVSTADIGVSTFKSRDSEVNKRGIQFKIIEGGSEMTTLLFEPSGDIINGWQKIEGELSVTTNTADVVLQIQVPENSTDYYDDIRIHPVNAGLQTYVYNKLNMKVSAVLDQNNYATLYYYDQAGNLFLVKKETEKGIMTIQETFSHQKESQ